MLFSYKIKHLFINLQVELIIKWKELSYTIVINLHPSSCQTVKGMLSMPYQNFPGTLLPLQQIDTTSFKALTLA